MILAGDIGGTNTRLALIVAKKEGLQILFEKTFPNAFNHDRPGPAGSPLQGGMTDEESCAVKARGE